MTDEALDAELAELRAEAHQQITAMRECGNLLGLVSVIATLLVDVQTKLARIDHTIRNRP
jgi:hypothetical protein